MPTPQPKLPGFGGHMDPCPSHGVSQAGAVGSGCRFICVPSAAVVQAAPVGVPVVLGGGLCCRLRGRCRTTSQIQGTKVDTCVYTSGVLGSPHQMPEKETRPWARFLHTRGPPESAWNGGRDKVRGSSLSLTLPEGVSACKAHQDTSLPVKPYHDTLVLLQQKLNPSLQPSRPGGSHPPVCPSLPLSPAFLAAPGASQAPSSLYQGCPACSPQASCSSGWL